MTSIQITPWGRFLAKHRQEVVRRWLVSITKSAQAVFTAGMNGRHTGRIYRRKGRLHQASAPGEFPATDTGRLLASFKRNVTRDEAKVGTDMHYSKYLRQGTKKMARRKMSDNAMREGVEANKGRVEGWVAWQKK